MVKTGQYRIKHSARDPDDYTSKVIDQLHLCISYVAESQIGDKKVTL